MSPFSEGALEKIFGEYALAPRVRVSARPGEVPTNGKLDLMIGPSTGLGLSLRDPQGENGSLSPGRCEAI